MAATNSSSPTSNSDSLNRSSSKAESLNEDELPDIIASVPLENLGAPDFVLGRSPDIRTRVSVCYIVVGILYRGVAENLEFCLVQEAKQSCRGKWYLPAGRVEPGETLEVALKREVREESGYECEPRDLLAVEAQGGGWFRFSFICRITGGELKQQPDAESLSAQWFMAADIGKTAKLRAPDIKSLIENARRYEKSRRGAEDESCSAKKPSIRVSPSVVPGMFYRLLVAQKKADYYEILMSRDTANVGHPSLPLVEFSLSSFGAAVISKFYRELIQEGSSALGIPTRCIGVQGLPETTPTEGLDGVCITLLVLVKNRADAKVSREDRYFWHQVKSTEINKFINNMAEHGPHFYLL